MLADADGAVLTSWYERNQGDPLAGLLPYLADLIDSLPEGAWIQSSVATGYGAQLAQAALGSLSADVETVAHLKAACRLVPDATYVIDIGGQDMKCLKARDGLIAGVTLNEACSAGCGAFLETFARSLNLSMEAFVRAALFARHPVDLGSRCTVFMNSKVKQAQKEGADIGDIAAGLCYAVARNALYKVLRLRTPAELGDRVLVQGGSFLNDALLRVMERLLDHHVCRPDIAGLMGAYGAALLARSRTPDGAAPTPLTSASLRSLDISAKTLRCKGCGNHCLLTVNRFSNGRKLVSGNRCERGASGGEAARPSMPNLYAWKERRLFGYEPLPQDGAPRGRIGIPRVLNMYEHYPFWFTLFTELGYRVELSPPSGKELFESRPVVHALANGLLPRQARARAHRLAPAQGAQAHLFPLPAARAPGEQRRRGRLQLSGGGRVPGSHPPEYGRTAGTGLHPVHAVRVAGTSRTRSLPRCMTCSASRKRSSAQPYASPPSNRKPTAPNSGPKANGCSPNWNAPASSASCCPGGLTMPIRRSITVCPNSSPPSAPPCSARTVWRTSGIPPNRSGSWTSGPIIPVCTGPRRWCARAPTSNWCS